ncbi:MAG TPA: dihydrodipicolinate synthase family protein [Solirubrobacteraceae bacterium]|jgi:4-hydroxy-tetrahydrodipicolinate synthase|nr:dihydrodipicolinate synthase family protein [Solirubrobacteraceae bacterium]
MTRPSWAGIFPSIATPFQRDGGLDLEGQRAIVSFAVESGSHGLICFGLAGEVFRLTPSERLELLSAIVEECNGRIPVLAGVGTEAEHTSVQLARAAASVGADGLVVPPPLTAPASSSELLHYFETVGNAVDLPIMIQDAPEYLKVEVGPSVVAQLVDRLPNLAALKLEVAADALAPWVEAFAERLNIFCGNGGLYLLDCLRFGAAGIAPGVDLVDVLVDIHELWQADQAEEAWQRLRMVLPMIAFQMQDIDHYNATAKYVLGKRGILPAPHLRAPAYRLDASGEQIMDEYLDRLKLVAVTDNRR